MSKRTLVGLMLCTLFLSAPVFAQPSTAQPVIQTAQAVQNDVTIPAGATQEFDAAKGEIKFDGVLTNKGTIIIKSSDPAQTEAILRASKVVNEGKIVSEVQTVTIETERITGPGEVSAPESIGVHNAKELWVIGGHYKANYFRPSTDGKLTVQARRIDAKVDLKAFDLSIGVFEGHLNVVKQKLDGDPIYYNVGGDVSTVDPGSGFDIWVLAAGNVNLSGVDATGLNGEVRDFVAVAGLHFVQTTGQGVIGCGTYGCYPTIQDFSQPGQILEGDPNTYPPSGTITINGAIARHIDLSARDIVINGTLDARQDNRPGSPSIILTAANSITVNAPLKTEATTQQDKEGSVYLQAPTINVNAKITSDAVNIYAFENDTATTGSITTAAIEARTSYIHINGGHIQFADVGGALTGGAVLPLSQPHDSGEFTIKTGKLTAHRYIMLAATGNIDAGNIELLPNESPVPLGAHDVRIHANVGKEDAPPLKIGGGTNGAASITVQGTTDYGPQKTGKIFLTNGPSGDIVLDGAKIHITNEHEGTPSLIASAGTGQVTVKGNIVFDGTATAPAGQILLVGDEIRSTGATISVKDTLADAFERPAKVILATSKLTLAGNLTIEANSKAQTSVKVLPKGSIIVDPQDYSESLPHFVDNFPVNVTEDEVLVRGSSNLMINAKSVSAKVEISAKPLRFNINGSANIKVEGDESQINVNYGEGSPSGNNSLVFSLGSVTFDASSTDSSAGDINIQADRITGQAGASVNLFARSNGSAESGGNVFINARTVRLYELPTNIDVSSFAEDGNGGVIDITTIGDIEFAPNSLLKANGNGSGTGGSIRMSNTNQMIGIEYRIEAKGGETGIGGDVLIANADLFDVNDLVKVDAGSATSLSAFDGSVTLNQVECRQWKTGYSWPQTYWNCTDNNPPNAAIQAPADVANTLPGSLKDALQNDHTVFYVFPTMAKYNNFFNRSEIADIGGITFKIDPGVSQYVSVLRRSTDVNNNTVTFNVAQMKESAGHEIGHAVDFTLGQNNQSKSGTYDLYVRNDFVDLDYIIAGPIETLALKRPACSSNNTAPFDNVVDATTGALICDPITHELADSDFVGKSNSFILQTTQGNIFLDWTEVYTQSFAYEAHAFNSAPSDFHPFTVTADGVFRNGFFLCTRAGWADDLLEKQAVSGGCTDAIPNWYAPGN